MFPYPTCGANIKPSNVLCPRGTTVVLCDPVLTRGHIIPTEQEGLLSGQVLWLGQIGTGMSRHWPRRRADCPVKPLLFGACCYHPPSGSNLSLWQSHFYYPLNTIGKDSSSLLLLTVASFTVWFHPQPLLIFGWLSGPPLWRSSPSEEGSVYSYPLIIEFQ